MKAVLCKSYGPPESLVVEDISDPVVGKGEILTEVTAASLNFFDTLIIQGKYQVKPQLPFSPGAEYAGRVVEVGEGVSGFAPGDRVMAYAGFGACREKMVADASRHVPIPDGVSDEVASGLIVTYGTSIHGLRDRANLQPGETLAVLGASGGVGVSAIEIGKAMGARVIACASSDEKLAFCKEHGADEGINYSKQNLKEALKAATDGKGADVIYDPVGGDFSEAALRATAWGGRFLVIGFATGEIPRIPLNLTLLKGCSVMGVFWGSFIARDPAGYQANNKQILDWVLEGKLKPHVHGVYPLDKTSDAIGAIARREVMGKLVVKP